MLARPARIDFSSQPCNARPASKRSSRWYSWRARLFSAMVPLAPLPLFFAPLPLSLAVFVSIRAFSPKQAAGDTKPMPEIHRSALVGHSAARMYALVNDVAAYPRRFAWCDAARILEEGPNRMVARLDLRMGAFKTGFTTETTRSPPRHVVLPPVD